MPQANFDPIISQGARPLNYDLEVLCASVKRHSVKRLLLFFQDSEALNGSLISDLIELLRYVFKLMMLMGI